MSAQPSPRPVVIKNHPNEASDDGLRQVSWLGTYLLSALCKLYRQSLGCQSWGYLRAISFAAMRAGYRSIQASTYNSRTGVELLLQWSHSDEIGILVLPRHRPCAVAGCFAAAKLPAGLAGRGMDGMDGWMGWADLAGGEGVTHDALGGRAPDAVLALGCWCCAGGGVHVT